MEIAEKPPISILMAVYEPRMDWLREQLVSLNEQTYPNLRLYLRDDCSPTVPLTKIEALVEECVTAFPWILRRNDTNLGSNGTFARLTQEAEGDYFAYCDQDDVWVPQKLEQLETVMMPQVTMSYCDMAVIDGSSAPLARSLRQLRPRLEYLQGANLAERYFFRNCTAGCSALIRSDIAKAALPFPTGTVHDHWLAIVAAALGQIRFVEMPLVKYRQHWNNQTGVLSGVFNKKSYRAKRLEPLAARLESYRHYARPSPTLTAFVEGRLAGRVWPTWKYRVLSPFEARMELAMRVLPEKLFQICLERIK